jgi:UDP-N-acetylglucosamine transferase subunit ALG13
MIFVTIGSHQPFDRLIRTIDEIAPSLNEETIIAQVCKTNYKVKNIQSVEFVSPAEFNSYFTQAKLIISHAGMGTIISALVDEKPILVMPRLERYHETRNDHQLATARRLQELDYIHVAFDESELKDKVKSLTGGALHPLHKIGNYASPMLMNSIESFITS